MKYLKGQEVRMQIKSVLLARDEYIMLLKFSIILSGNSFLLYQNYSSK